MEIVLARVRPAALLRAQVIAIAAIAAIAVAIFLIALGAVRDRLEDSSEKTAAALLAFRVHDELSRSLDVLGLRAEEAIDVRGNRSDLRNALTGKAPSPATVDFSVPLSLKESALLQSTHDDLVRDASSLFQGSPSDANRKLLLEIESLQVPLNLYLNDPTGANFRRLYTAFATVESHARDAIPNLVSAANSEDRSLRFSVERGGFAILAALVAVAALIIIVTVAVSQRVRSIYEMVESEHLALRRTTDVLQHRNDQMNALYTVFTEITDTLSLRYVVSAALREALKLMKCHGAILRMVKDGQLIVAGSLTEDGGEIPGIGPREMGQDPVGRVAKRGRPLLIGDHNRELIAEIPAMSDCQSGLIIPLIIGARVVGTLSVWSKQRNAYNEEDERILSMMGSQVATAMIAADTTDTSEHRAHHDPLTQLPNRLELMEDMDRELNTLHMGERRAVVGMIDIDHFKHFNDDYGHRVGDVSLQKVAMTLRHALRDSDRIYRYGGEEFVVVLMDVDMDTGFSLAEHVRLAVCGTPLTGDQLEPVGPVTISMGLASYPEDGRDFASLIEMADLAMYRAKALGRDKVATWSRDVVNHAA